MKGDKPWAMNPDHPEYQYMWDRLSKLEINRPVPDKFVAWNEQYGESWQYMGTWSKEGAVTHEFRHRAHPTTNEKIVIRIPASSAYDGKPLIYEEVFGEHEHVPF